MSDPVTLGTIIKADIALSELLSQSDEERRQANWRSDTTAALARIEFKVDDILREILQLRLAFNEDLTRLYLNQRHALYAAFIQRLGTLTEKDTDEIRALITTPASGLLDSVTSFGKDRDSAQRPYYAGFSIAMRGLGALFIAANLISFERTRVLTVCQSLIDDFISLAVDPNATDSFASRAATERAFQQQQRDWLSAHAAGQIWLLGMRIVRRSRLGDSAESMSFVGVAISGTVLDHIGNKLDLRFDELGEQSLKNIATPVRVCPQTLCSIA